MILLALLACAVEPADTAAVADTAVAVDTDTDTDVAPPARPELVAPPEAADLDPDPSVLSVALTAAPATHHVAGLVIDGFAYDGLTPGPVLRAKVGDTLAVALTNDLDTGTTIHWHGVHAPYAMDGVTWTTDPIAPGAGFEYRFTLDHAGTFWYHPHFDTERQVDLGLYGMLVVEDPAEPVADLDLPLVLDTWAEHDASEDHHVPAVAGTWTVNGLVDPVLRVASGSTVRARFVNAANVGYAWLSGPGRVIAEDQGLLAAPRPLEGLLLAPGDRAEVEWDVGSEPFAVTLAPYSLAGGPALGDPVELLSVEPIGDAPAPEPLAFAFSGAAPSPDPGIADVVYAFSGDVHGGPWRINGEVFPDVTVEALPLGADAVIEVRNVSGTEHPFHLHGLAFEVLSVNGTPPATRTIADTWNVRIRDVVRLRLVADNPGFWMAHCHILPHAHGGMMTVLQVGDPAE